MITKELVDFIKAEKTKGRNEEEIKTLLLQNGWNEGDIKEGFKAFKSILPFTDFKKSWFFLLIGFIVFLFSLYNLFWIILGSIKTFDINLILRLTNLSWLIGLISSILIFFTKNRLIYIISKLIALIIFLYIVSVFLFFVYIFIVFFASS